MAFIKRVCWLAIWVGIWLLAGCGSLDKKAINQVEPTLIERDIPADPNQVLNIIPNPYTQQTVVIEDEARGLFEQALSYMANSNWSAAEIELQNLIAGYPKLSGPWVNLGIVYARQNRTPDADHAWKKAIEVNSLNNDAYNLLALSKREQGDFKSAEELYLTALNAWPHSVDSNRNLGILYDLYMGKLDRALELYELSEKLLGKPDKQLKGWIIDLKRRMVQQKKN